jgi:rSAM/selenodomain-associated transferase 1
MTSSEVQTMDETDRRSGSAIVVMAKTPRPGTVKTRLCPPLSAEAAADLASCLLRDTVAGALASGAPVMVAYSPGDGREMLESLLPPGLHWAPQRGGDLGARMHGAMEAAGALGYSPTIIVGTDSPTLPRGILTTAIDALCAGAADVVFGPSEDGGYYLAGAAAPVPGLFENVAWSSARALDDSLRNAEALGLRTLTLPTWYDVDTAQDLERLADELRSGDGSRSRAPHTAGWLDLHPDRRP